MPEAKIKARGGALRWRTIKLAEDKYKHIAVTRKPGPRGGRTVAGPTRKVKAAAKAPRRKMKRSRRRKK